MTCSIHYDNNLCIRCVSVELYFIIKRCSHTQRKVQFFVCMAIMQIILYINYALPHCTTDMIRAKFDSMFAMPGVTHIAEQLKNDTKIPGKQFKRFWIYVDCYVHDPTMSYLLESIEKEGFAKVFYEKTQGLDRYWKVKRVLQTDFLNC